MKIRGPHRLPGMPSSRGPGLLSFSGSNSGGNDRPRIWIPAQGHTGKTMGGGVVKITDLDSRSGAYGKDGGELDPGLGTHSK